MAKESGLGWTSLSIDDAAGSAKDLRNDISTFDFATPRGVFDWTGVDKQAIERGLGLADFTINLTFPAFNDAADRAHSVMKTVPSATVARTTLLVVSGQTLTNEVWYTDYALNRGADGGFTASVPGVLADGTVPAWS